MRDSTVMVKEEVLAVALLESVTCTRIVDEPAAVGVPLTVTVSLRSVRVSPLGSVPERSEKELLPEPPEGVSVSE